MRDPESTPDIRPRREALVAALGHLAAALIAIGGVWWVSARHLESEMQESLVAVAQAAAAVVDGDLHQSINTPEQTDTVEYDRCIAPLRAIHGRLDSIKYLYTVVLDVDDVRFVLDTATPGDHDGDGVEDRSPTWSPYADYDDAMALTLRVGRANANTTPQTDLWGTFISGYAPIFDSAGRRVGAVGADMTADVYLGHLAAARRSALLGLVPAGLLSISAGVVTYRLRRRAARDGIERRRAADTLQKRERCLNTLVGVQRELLTNGVADDPCHERILELLGRTSGASRVYTFDNHRDSAGRLRMSQTAEWCAEGIAAQLDNPALQDLPYDESVPRWAEMLARGDLIVGHVDGLPARERDWLAPRGVQSIAVLPLTADGEVFGFIGFDVCSAPRAWDPAELDLLRSAAATMSMLQEWRYSQRRLTTIVDAIPAGIVLVDRETHTVAEANPAALAMLGAPRDAVIGAVCHKYICPAERGRCPVTDLNEKVNDSERILLAADGTRVPILKTVVPVTIRGRAYLLESFVDITVRKRAENELAAQQERLEELVDERTRKLIEAERQVLQGEKLASVGRLAAGVAHEINTPIQYVGDNLRALAEFYEDTRSLVDKYRELVELVAAAQLQPDEVAAIREAEQAHDLEFILEDTPKAISQGLEGVERVASIVRAMKDFSHVKGGEVECVDLNRSLQSTLTVARNEYKYVADVKTQYGDLPLVECHAGELNQVFLNLLVNAAHAVQDSGRRGEITISTRPDGEHVEITFADTGVGIPAEIRNRIYEPFFTTKVVGRGTGQGLSIARQIVVGTHKGQLTCESEVGVGTTFTIRLPMKMVKAPAHEGIVA